MIGLSSAAATPRGSRDDSIASARTSLTGRPTRLAQRAARSSTSSGRVKVICVLMDRSPPNSSYGHALQFPNPPLDSPQYLLVAGVGRLERRPQRDRDVIHPVNRPRRVDPV